MGKRQQKKRVVAMAIVLGIAFLGLAFRLFDLQVLRHSDLKVKALEFTQRETIRKHHRGDILDCNGKPLATSVIVKNVEANPELIGKYNEEVALALAPLLELDVAWLAEQLKPSMIQRTSGLVPRQWVPLKKRVPTEKWEQIEQAMRNLVVMAPEEEKALKPTEKRALHALRRRAITAQSDQMRVYPGQTLAAHLLGFVGSTNVTLGGKTIPEIVGVEGLERVLNTQLRGSPGWLSTERDGKGREIVRLRSEDVQPRDGLNVVLTIDSFIQHGLELALAETMAEYRPVSVSGVVVRPATGEILAMATIPTFNPNQPGESPPEARRNRVIADLIDPGSTFKPVVVSGALHDGTVRLTDTFDCEHRYWFYGGHPLRDTHPYGLLTVEEIIAKSSNIGTAKIGIRMGAESVYSWIRAFGFGSRSGIPLPGEVGGIVPPVNKWSKVSIARLPIGQGVSVTRLQMTMAICAIANRGQLMRPMLVDRLEDQEGRVVAEYSPQPVRQVISEATARQITVALKRVVSTNGTASGAMLKHYTVAGKTGTAQKVENGTYVSKYLSSFIGFFPADEPELCIAIIVDDPSDRNRYYGGTVATPAFKKVAELCASYLNIRPDLNPDPGEGEQPAKTSVARAR